MQLLLAFSIFMTFVYLPWDVLIKPLGEDQEVWFGVCWFAKLGGLLLGWFMAQKLRLFENETLMYPWSVIYLLQIALGMLVWSLLDERGGGLATGSIVVFLLIAYSAGRNVPDSTARFDGEVRAVSIRQDFEGFARSHLPSGLHACSPGQDRELNGIRD